MALFIGFTPIFILCLLFKKTAPLFQKWLYYGLATIFSGVMLGVMADISMDLVTNLGVTDAISSFTGVILTGQSATGIMQTVTQQLGLGLLLSTLLITVPPMAGLFFNGVMGSYSGFGPMTTLGTGQQQNLPPSMGGQPISNRWKIGLLKRGGILLIIMAMLALILLRWSKVISIRVVTILHRTMPAK